MAKVKASKFREGDMVRRTGKTTEYLTKGQIYEITQVLSDGSLKIKGGKDVAEYMPSRFELVEASVVLEEHDTKFKIGDVVRCTRDAYGKVAKGENAVVTGYSPGNSRFMSIKGGNGFMYSDSDFEPIAAFDPPEFKQGDKVTLIDDYMNVQLEEGCENKNKFAEMAGCEHGWVYTVKEAENTYIKVYEDANGYWINRNQFKLAEGFVSPSPKPPETTQAVVETTTMKPTKFETVQYINDTRIQDFSAQDQGHLIERIGDEITRLEAFQVKTKAIVREIKEHKASLKVIVAQFDSLEDA